MATWVTPIYTMRLPFRLEFWNWTSRRHPSSVYRNLAIYTPYSETSPMIALRQHPVSNAPLDPSIFEADDEEYDFVSMSLPPLSVHASLFTASATTHSSILIRLLQQGRYEDADRVRTEMTQMGLHIEPNHIYEQAAMHALEMEQEREYRLKSFTDWITLIPSRNKGRSMPKFDRFLYILLEKHPPDILFITRFATVCVSKGYTQTFPQRIIPFIVRFAEPSVSLAFLDELRAAAIKYEYFNMAEWMPKLKRWYSQAIRTYAAARRLPYAVKTLHIAQSHGINPTRFTYDFLLQYLKQEEGDHSENIEFVTKLRRQQRWVGVSPMRSPSSTSPCLDSPNVTTEQVDPFDYTSPRNSDLVVTLRTLWRTVGTPKNPSAVALAGFFEAYISTQGRMTALHLLRRKTQRAGIGFRAHWALAEMLYLGKQKQWPQVLSTFDDYFYSSGVPNELRLYKKAPADFGLGRREKWRETRGLQSKIFPSIFHTCLVWRALVEITNKSTVLPGIYQQLLFQAGNIFGESPSSDSTSPASIKPPLSQAFDAAHFTPFLYSLFRKSKTQIMMGVFSDMARLGLEPRLPHMALLAGAHAMRGDFDECFDVLDMVEETLAEERQAVFGDIPPSTISEEEFQRYLVLYLPSFSGFLKRKNLRGAFLVRDRLFKHGYVKGSNERVEENLVLLKEVRLWWRRQSLMQSRSIMRQRQ